MEAGIVLAGNQGQFVESLAKLDAQQVDQIFDAPEGWKPPEYETTLAKPFAVTGPGTYTKGTARTLHFEPADNGWAFNRTDLPEQLPVRVAAENVWTAQRSIVLRSGSEHNYVRMAEHIIAHKLGLCLDNVCVSMENGDPPLFNVGSMPIVEAILAAGIVENENKKARYFTVKEPVTIVAPNGAFLNFQPGTDKHLTFDVAIDFPTAIGKQRIKFELCNDAFTYGAHARTNCPRHEMLYAMTVGRLFADIRNLGYTRENILIAGKHDYVNEPGLMHEGKSLEAVWHRSCLDLIAALSLFDGGRLSGHITSYKAGHCLDCRLMTLIQLRNLWQEI